VITINIPAVSYAIGAGAFLILTLLLLTAWRGRLQGGLLVSASALTAVWCAAVVAYATYRAVPFSALQLLEVLRNGAWCLFLLKLLGLAKDEARASSHTVRVLAAIVLAICIGLVAVILINRYSTDLLIVATLTSYVAVFGHVLLAVAGLVLIEQIYRNTPREQRWGIKFLCIGVGGLFVYDFYLYANGLLFKQLDGAIWAARGLVFAMVVPLLAVSARRNPQWSLDVFVSRHVVFHTAALLGAGVYLLIMAAAGYYIRAYGGTWGGVAQTVFLFGAVVLLALLVQSGQLRSRAKVFVGKHFYRNRYDYREEWLRFTQTLSRAEAEGRELKETIVTAIAEIVESPGGVLWLRNETGTFEPAAAVDADRWAAEPLAPEVPMVRFLEEDGWVVFLDEYRRDPDHYAGLEIPQSIEALDKPWVIVPLMQGESLVAIIVLRRSSTRSELNWEDSDLLKTVGRQAASYLVLWQTSDALGEARQFEAFNRLSAYVVHDLKNLVAQLDLVVDNAKRHLHAPGFVEDAIQTVGNASAKMNRMLGQLRAGRMEARGARPVRLDELLGNVVAARGVAKPVPVLEACEQAIRVSAEPDRLGAVITHLIQNAQEATPADGQVTVRVQSDGDWAVIEVEDNGSGMDRQFIAERLFKPFDTTKGNAGMGVGVYESREFVQSLGGELFVESELHRGTLFRLKLPVTAADEAAASDTVPREATR
jgi:putative PEP-CTERM system histidine kinase